MGGWIASILERPTGGTGRALDFLDHLEAEIKANKEDLEAELRGNEMMGVEGKGSFYRIVDDSGEDFLYPVSHFRLV